MKRIILLSVVGVSRLLSGCASRYAGPAVLGGVIGYAIGQNNNQQRAIVHSPNVVIVQEYSVCDKYALYNERQSCLRGNSQRIVEDNRRREQEAYRQGYGR